MNRPKYVYPIPDENLVKYIKDFEAGKNVDRKTFGDNYECVDPAMLTYDLCEGDKKTPAGMLAPEAWMNKTPPEEEMLQPIERIDYKSMIRVDAIEAYLGKREHLNQRDTNDLALLLKHLETYHANLSLFGFKSELDLRRFMDPTFSQPMNKLYWVLNHLKFIYEVIPCCRPNNNLIVTGFIIAGAFPFSLVVENFGQNKKRKFA